MKINVDLNLCEKHGQCVSVAPGIFSFDDDEELAWSEMVGDDARDLVQQAVKACPVQAISIED